MGGQLSPARLAEVMEATWPPARSFTEGPWRLRDGQGGGQRVSATTAEGDWTVADLPLAETAMTALGQKHLFLIRAGDAALDAALEARGYRINDPVVAYAVPAEDLAQPVSGMAAFLHWPPLAIAADIWAAGGIGPARLAVMDRVAGPKVAILGRTDDTPSGAAFVAVSGDVAMLHALEVPTTMRRRGAAAVMMRAAAGWAVAQGATTFAVVVTEANDPARALYARLGMVEAGRYHYRLKD